MWITLDRIVGLNIWQLLAPKFDLIFNGCRTDYIERLGETGSNGSPKAEQVLGDYSLKLVQCWWVGCIII